MPTLAAAQAFLPGRNLRLAGWSPQQLHRLQDPIANHLSLPPTVPLTNIIGDETLAPKLKGKKGSADPDYNKERSVASPRPTTYPG